MIIVLHVVALLLYTAAAGIQIGVLARGQRVVPRSAPAVLGVAVIAHAVALGFFVATYHELPLVGLAPSISTLAFLLGVILLVLAHFSDARPVGLVLLPIVAGLLLLALLLQIRPAGQVLAFRGAWLAFHVMLGFIGYVGLAVAFAAGLLYLLQFRQLKSKQFGRLFRFFPALATLDRLGRLGLQIGFPSLTLNLILGWAWTIR
ncbi:MAG TPA: cytochrome c biogenesis protein CcsA, partial [Longimicrobiales bacterium]